MQNNVGGQVPKYRASCDSCNEAKVRCSQTRPSCARCLKSQSRRCVYGVSKRSGKHNGKSSTKAEVGAKNGTVARHPTTPTSTTGIETPSSSSSTIDPREFLQMFSGSNTDPSDLLKGQQLPKNWPFENNRFTPTQHSSSQGSPANYNNYQLMFGKDESHMSNAQDHGLGLFDGVSHAELGACSLDGSSVDQSYSYPQSNTECASCSTANRQDEIPSLRDICRCNEVIITQLSLLPVLLVDSECSTFDVELVQLQKAIRLCAGALACNCPGKDYTSILTISMLIARIISVFERSGAQVGRDDENNSDQSLMMTGAMTPVPSPKFSVGIYELEGEDENNLKREMWWIHIRKVESLVAGYKDMLAKMAQQQAYQDTFHVAAWEKLVFVLDQKVQAVKRDWRVYRDKA